MRTTGRQTGDTSRPSGGGTSQHPTGAGNDGATHNNLNRGSGSVDSGIGHPELSGDSARTGGNRTPSRNVDSKGKGTIFSSGNEKRATRPHTPLADRESLGPWTLVTRKKRPPAKANQTTKTPRPATKSTPSHKTSIAAANTKDAPTTLNSQIPPTVMENSSSPVFSTPQSGVEISKDSIADPLQLNDCPGTSQELVVFNASMEKVMGRRLRSEIAATSKELARLDPLPHLPRKRRKNSLDIADGGDASPMVDQ